MSLLPNPLKSVANGRSARSTIKAFADEIGLVYFGYVDQHDEDNRIVRGMTVSVHHTDAHYCIGSYEGYDMALVERTDVLKPMPHMKKASKHRWYIMEFDLHTSVELPHFFVGLHEHSESFYRQLFAKYPHLRPASLGNLGSLSLKFNAKYRVYAAPENALTVETILKPEVNEMISQHFGSLAIEVTENSLYVYAETPTISMKLLDAMTKNGVWLARHIDTVSKSI